MRDLVQWERLNRAACVIPHDGGSLSLIGFRMGGGILVAIQDCIFGGMYHGGALALRRKVGRRK